MENKKPIRQAGKKRADLARQFLAIWTALQADKRNGVQVRPQIERTLVRLGWHAKRVRTYFFSDINNVKHTLGALGTVKPKSERIKIIEQCEKALKKLIKQLVPDLEAAKAANLLAQTLSVEKKACVP